MTRESIPINARVRIIDGTFKGHDAFVRQQRPRCGDYVADYLVEIPKAVRYYIASKYLEVIPDEPAKPKSRWKVGDRVRIMDGDLAGKVGGVYNHDSNGHPVVAVGDDLIPYLDDWLEWPLGSMREEWDKVSKPASRVAPTVADTVAGIVAWQQVDAQLRRYNIQGTGHVVQAWITILPDPAARTIKFLFPFSAAEVPIMLDDLAKGPPERTAVVVGRETSDDPVDAAVPDGGY